MENISKEVESNDIKIDKFFEVAKVIDVYKRQV